MHFCPLPSAFCPRPAHSLRARSATVIIARSRGDPRRMSTYLGNDTLSPAVKERVISTFQQTLALYKQGRTDEVVAGCGLILRMDPMFDPAKKLLDKIRNPALAIDVDSLGTPAPVMNTANAMEEARNALAARDFQKAINLTTEILTNDLMNDNARIPTDHQRDQR